MGENVGVGGERLGKKCATSGAATVSVQQVASEPSCVRYCLRETHRRRSASTGPVDAVAVSSRRLSCHAVSVASAPALSSLDERISCDYSVRNWTKPWTAKRTYPYRGHRPGRANLWNR